MPTIGGENAAQILVSRFRILNYAFPGRTFADTTYGGSLPLRKSAAFVFDPVVRPSTEKREWISAKQAKCPIDIMANDYNTIKTLFYLQQYNAQYQAELSNGNYLNFVPDTDTSTPHSANGSLALSLGESTYEVTPQDSSWKAELSGKIYNENIDWMLANLTANAGGIGATATQTGITGLAYDAANFSEEGFFDMFIGATSPTDSFGIRNQSKFTIKFTKQDDDEYMRPIIKNAEIDIETALLQSIPTNAQTLETYRNSDFVFKVPLRSGVTHIFHKCLSIVTTPDYEDEKTYLKVRLKGEVKFDNLGTSSSNIVFTDATKTIDWYLSGYTA